MSRAGARLSTRTTQINFTQINCARLPSRQARACDGEVRRERRGVEGQHVGPVRVAGQLVPGAALQVLQRPHEGQHRRQGWTAGGATKLGGLRAHYPEEWFG